MWRDVKLAICVADNHNVVDGDFHWNLSNLWKPRLYAQFRSRQHIKSASLNELVVYALKAKMDYLLFLDTDMVFPQHTIKQLLSNDVPVVGGYYHLKSYPFAPVCGWTEWQPDGTPLRKNSRGELWKSAYDPLPMDSLVQVDWTGIGCLLVRADVFEQVKLPCFRDIWDDELGTRKIGHDMEFFDQLQRAGVPLYVDTKVDCGHRTSLTINRLYVEAFHKAAMFDAMCDLLPELSGLYTQEYTPEEGEEPQLVATG